MRACDLRAEALRLLDAGVVQAFGEALGEVSVAGSAALDLMVWRDTAL